MFTLAFFVGATILTGILSKGKPVEAMTENNTFFGFATSTNFWIGPGNPTMIARNNPRRQYFEIGNISGATTTPQAVYCSTNPSLPAFTGIFINASSTKTFNYTGIPLGFMYCRSQTSSTTITVVEI